MALIKHGSFDSLPVSLPERTTAARPALRDLRTFSLLREATRSVQESTVTFPTSGEARGLALKNIKLTKGFEGFLQKLFNKTNEVYFLSLAWDMSGQPAVHYPEQGAEKNSCLITMGVEEVREFIGAGVLLFPARAVTSGLAVRIQLWESDLNARDFGATLKEVAEAVKSSKLNNLLSLLAMVGGTTTATIGMIKNAALELMDITGEILKSNSDDYVDFFEGYFPVTEKWTKGTQRYVGHASEIELTRFV